MPVLGVGDDPAQEGAAAPGVPFTLLGDPVDGRPGPAGLPGQDHQPVQIRVEAQITVG